MNGRRAKEIRDIADEIMARREQRRFTTYVEIDHGPRRLTIFDEETGLPMTGLVDRITVQATGWRRLYRNLKRDFKRRRSQPMLPLEKNQK